MFTAYGAFQSSRTHKSYTLKHGHTRLYSYVTAQGDRNGSDSYPIQHAESRYVGSTSQFMVVLSLISVRFADTEFNPVSTYLRTVSETISCSDPYAKISAPRTCCSVCEVVNLFTK